MIDLKRIVRPNILKLKAYSSARDEFKGKEGTFLDANENPYGNLNRYPDPKQKAVKEKLASLKNTSADNIFIGNGSDEVIELAFRIFCTPGKDKALTFTPTYGMYQVSADINDVELLQQALTADFQIDTKAALPILQDETVKLVFICSPNNPTGNVMRTEDILFLLENFKGIVIVDEAYIDFAKSSSCIELINQYNNLIVSQTFSKAWGLAAARVGTAYMNPELLDLYNKVKPPYNVSVLNQEAALNALNQYGTYKEQLQLILSERARLQTVLSGLDAVKHIYPTDANFLLIEVENADKLYADLVAKRVIVRNRSSYVPNCLRISVGTPEENDLFLNAFQELTS